MQKSWLLRVAGLLGIALVCLVVLLAGSSEVWAGGDDKIVSLKDDKFTFAASECAVIGTTLTKNDLNDAAGTDQVTCTIKRSALLPAAGENPLNFDHTNIVVVEAADDEILTSEAPVYVNDDDDAVVQVRQTDVKIDKSDATVTSNGDGTYKAVYTIAVENDGAAGKYTLEDTFKFGPGVDVVGTPVVTVVPNTIGLTAGFNGKTQKEIAKDVPIAAGPDTKHTYTVTVNVKADVRGDVTYIDCKLGDTSGAGSGLLNLASVSVDGGTPITDDGCGDVPAVEFAKSNPTVTSNGDGTYNAVYTITAENTGGKAGSYTLTDTFGFSAGVSVVGAPVVVLPAGVTPTAGFNGAGQNEIAANVAIPANTKHTYTVTVKVSVDVSDPKVDYTECATTPGSGQGLFNEASITVDGGPAIVDNGCGDVPAVEFAKSNPTVTSNGDGTYNAVYTITAENTGGKAGSYTLTDTFGFSAGVSVVGAPVVVLPAGVTPTAGFNGAGQNEIAANVAIPANTKHTYTVTVKVSVDVSDPKVDYTECATTPGSGQGLFNEASITVDGGPAIVDNGCGDVPAVEFAKSNPTVTSNGDGTYNAVYTITAENTGGKAGSYTLTDTFGFSSGVTILGVDPVTVDPNTIVPNGTFNGASDKVIVTDQTIGANTKHTYTVTVKVKVSVVGDIVYTTSATTPGSGQGLFNEASITVDGGPAIVDNGCGDVPAVEFAKSNPTVTSNGDGTYNAVYTITAENTGGKAGSYTLTDTFGFSSGVTILGVDPVTVDPNTIGLTGGFNGDDQPEIAKDVAIAANAIHTYRVTVTVSVDVSDPTVAYNRCSVTTTPGAGEGLFNSASITVDGGDPITDAGCGDIPGDLKITKDDGDVTAIAGGAPFTYTLTVTNVGGVSTGSPVTVTDVLPAQFEWVGFPNTVGALPFCTQTDQTLACDIDPTLVDVGGKSMSFVVTAKAKEGITPSTVGYENLSSVDSPLDPAPESPVCPVDGPPIEEDVQVEGFTVNDVIAAVVEQVSDAIMGNPLNNVSCDTTPVIDGKIEVTKTDSIADADRVVNGEQFTYTLNVKNVGSSPVDTVTMADDLPLNIELVSVVAGDGWTCNAVDPIACTYAKVLAAGGTTTDVVLTVKVSDAFVGTQIDNKVVSTAIVRTGDGPDDDKKTVTDDDTEVTPLEPTLEVGGFAPVCVSDAPAIFYNIVPKGFVPTTPTATLRILDANKQPVDYNGDGVVNDGDKVVVPLNSGNILWPGATVVDGVAVDWPGWKLENGLWVEDPSDNFLRDGLFIEVSVNPTATTNLITYPPASAVCADPDQKSTNLAITKVASNGVPTQGDTFAWNLTVTNKGPDAATDVVVSDVVPAGLTVVSVADGDFDCEFVGNAVTCKRPELAVGASGSISIRTIVGANTVGRIENTATVTGRQPDPDLSDNTDSDVINVTVVDVLPPPPVEPPVAPPGGLPATGSDLTQSLQMAMVLLVFGLVMFATTRRRRHPST